MSKPKQNKSAAKIKFPKVGLKFLEDPGLNYEGVGDIVVIKSGPKSRRIVLIRDLQKYPNGDSILYWNENQSDTLIHIFGTYGELLTEREEYLARSLFLCDRDNPELFADFIKNGGSYTIESKKYDGRFENMKKTEDGKLEYIFLIDNYSYDEPKPYSFIQIYCKDSKVNCNLSNKSFEKFLKANPNVDLIPFQARVQKLLEFGMDIGNLPTQLQSIPFSFRAVYYALRSGTILSDLRNLFIENSKNNGKSMKIK